VATVNRRTLLEAPRSASSKSVRGSAKDFFERAGSDGRQQLSHSIHGILKFLQFTFEKHIFNLVAIHVRLHLAWRIYFGAAAVAKSRIQYSVIELDRRFAGIQHFH
jgi:hypothetical protein